MSYQQGLAFSLIAVTVGFFVWGRVRYDLVALGALLCGVLLGIIPAKEAFAGFSSDIAVIIACALVVSAAVARSGVIEQLLGPLLARLTTTQAQVPALVVAVTLLSMFTKNVGALAILMPVALQLARRTGTAPSRLLMPMAFGALLGGLATLVGTSPNIIVSDVRARLTGQPFGMFDYAPVGLSLALAGVIFLSFAYRLLPRSREASGGLEAALEAGVYFTEARTPDGWDYDGLTIVQLRDAARAEIRIAALIRQGRRRINPPADTVVQSGDTLLIEGGQEALDSFLAKARLELTRSDRPVSHGGGTQEVRILEAVVGPQSDLIGQSARRVDLYGQYGVNLIGLSRGDRKASRHLRAVRLRAGDIVMIQGAEQSLPAALQALGLLPLVERPLRLGQPRRRFMPVAVLGLAMVAVALQLLPVSVAFFAAAVAVVALGGLPMREAYSVLDGPVLVLVAALIPVSDAVQSTGGAALVGRLLAGLFEGLPPLAALVGVMAVAMAATPFLNNAATVLIVAPIGASLARQLGLHPDPFLMAVAVGAGCDFLTPVGHQCNTLVLGPGGYRFADYARLGAPLSLLVLALGPAAIALVWPLRAG